jgi:hypothetical protein
LSDPAVRPTEVALNAYAGGGEGVRGALGEASAKWALRAMPGALERFLKPPPPADPKNWKDERVGWGLVTFEQPGFTAAQYAANEDLCPALRKLLEKRGNETVLRFRPSSDRKFTLLRDYRNGKDLDIAGSPVGKVAGCIPRYLLLAGQPTADQLPWGLQYLLCARFCVGRLPFHPLMDEKLLAPYVNACIDDWGGGDCDDAATLVWSVDHSPTDITHLMRQSIAEPAFAKYESDTDLKAKAVRLAGPDATHDRLRAALAANKPALVVTTSHGMTGPLDDRKKMAAQLGLLVDQAHQPLQLTALLGAWEPGGAIWYAHACCAAGSDDGSAFAALFAEGTPARQVLSAVGELGAQVAPLPLALLSAGKPVRAFLGHVEPTFDWTLKQPATGQFLTSSLVKALYDELYLGAPVGQAFRDWYGAAATHFAAWDVAKRSYDGAEAGKAALLYHNLAARDVQTLVLLGDPAVTTA